MSLSQALSTSVSGLRTAQAGLALVASNVANAQTPGYVRKSIVQQTTASGDAAVGVRVGAIAREYDQYVQRQLRVERAGESFADLRAEFYQRLQQIYGPPGSANALESIYNEFLNSVQALASSPEQVPARSAVLSSGVVLAQHLNSMTASIQGLRSDAESGLGDAVGKANEAIRQIASINAQLSSSTAADASAAALQDRRDVYIDQLSELLDIKVTFDEQHQANVFTSSGIQLVGTLATQLEFDAQGTVGAQSEWSADPGRSTLGSIYLVSATGARIDLISNNSIRSGKLAAYLEMRDGVLSEAQAQLDEMAAAMAQALSDRTVAGTPVTSGPQQGFELDLSGLLAGNSIHLQYTDATSGAQRRITLMRVDDPGALPLKSGATADPNDEVIGINVAGGLATVAAQLNGHFNGKLTFSSPSGNVLRVLDDGIANNITIDAFSAKQTVTGLAGGSAELPFFMDGQNAFTGAITSLGIQSVGFAGRIKVNAALLADPRKLVAFDPTTSAGDPTRPDFIFQQLSATTLEFSPRTGIGSATSPFSGSLSGYLRQVLSNQGGAADAAANLAQGQKVVVNALEQRVAEVSGVNVDKEMANLLVLQAAYAANARVMSTVREMLDILMKM